MPSYNRVILMGNLTRDPELRNLGNDNHVAGFGLAVNRRFKDKNGERQEEVTFVDVECWGKTAELVAQYLTKGRAALIEGRLKLDQWEDKDGGKRSKIKVVAEVVQFLGSRDDGQQSGPATRTAPAADPYSPGGAAAVPPADLGDDSGPPF